MSSGTDVQLRLFLPEKSLGLFALSQDYLDEVWADWRPARPTVAFATYWYFAAERQAIYMRRMRAQTPPWTSDPIISQYRFTNVFRASDRVSQYLVRSVQYPLDQCLSEEDVLFRTLLFKVFNKIDTWEMLEREAGPITWRSYDFDTYDGILTRSQARGERIFSAAYIMPSGSGAFIFPRKHRSYLRLIEFMFNNGLPRTLMQSRSLREVFEALRSYPMMGDFLAFQYAIDLNYSKILEFHEGTFVVAGPGARDGIRKCFSETGGLSEEEIIRRMTERQLEEFHRLGLRFETLWGRRLQPIDCQNIFCEVDKYARVAHPSILGISGRTRIKQIYKSSPKGALSMPWFPPKWGLNETIKKSMAGTD